MLLLAIAVIAIAAQSCSSPEGCRLVEPAPEPNDAPLLVTGDYRVEVVGVQQVDCRGAEPEEFQGQVAFGFLDADHVRRDGGPISFELDGLMLTGSMEPGWLSASGSLDDPGQPTCDDVSEKDDTEASDERTSTHGGGSSGSGGEAPAGGDGQEDPESSATAALEVQVLSVGHAEGTLAVVTRECTYTVSVRMDLRGEHDSPPSSSDDGADGDTGANDGPSEGEPGNG
ncbi:MAG: hypothetical protein EXR69_16525 [Myxococcales bacterium]|nr:hypothetical protein [Myxococcales bacterium]